MPYSAFSSQRFTRGAALSSISETEMPFAGGTPSIAPKPFGGCGRMTTRQKRAVVGANAYVRTGNIALVGSSPGSVTSFVQLLPSSLVSRLPTGIGGAPTNCTDGAPAKVNACAVYGCGNSSWIHVSFAPFGSGSVIGLAKSPSTRGHESKEPAALVMRGLASRMLTTESGRRYASTFV